MSSDVPRSWLHPAHLRPKYCLLLSAGSNSRSPWPKDCPPFWTRRKNPAILPKVSPSPRWPTTASTSPPPPGSGPRRCRANPSSATIAGTQHRYNAACAAALAAAGQGKAEPPPDDAAKARLRQQALDWLKAELATWTKLLESGPPQTARRLQDPGSLEAGRRPGRHPRNRGSAKTPGRGTEGLERPLGASTRPAEELAGRSPLNQGLRRPPLLEERRTDTHFRVGVRQGAQLPLSVLDRVVAGTRKPHAG